LELQYYGANCLRLTTKKAQIVVDDNLAEVGLKSVIKPTDISLRTNVQIPAHEAQFTADMPGEYEVADVVIHGVATRSHIDEEGKKTATIFTVTADDLRVAIVGHVFPELSEQQLEAIGIVDILIIPVGGNGYTLDGVGALKVIKQIEPKVVIPVHYADKAIKYEVPQADLTEAVRALGMETAETLDKYKPKLTDLTDTTKLIVLNRQ
jgi:L-ascorbate metabolism protein UlaG (beta-lactamase superfamily)